MSVTYECRGVYIEWQHVEYYIYVRYCTIVYIPSPNNSCAEKKRLAGCNALLAKVDYSCLYLYSIGIIWC